MSQKGTLAMVDLPDHVILFRQHMPNRYLESVVRALFDCYEAADDKCASEFERPEAANIRPFYRRALIEQQLREIAQSFPQVRAEARRSPANAWNHTLVLCGRAAMTQNAASDPEDIVRPSLFRSMYAGKDNQRYLFPEMAPDEPSPDAIVYGILIHGRSEESAIFPGFARIVFPRPNLEGYLPGEIDLFEEFPEVVRAKTVGIFQDQAGVEQVAEPQPQLRITREKASEGA